VYPIKEIRAIKREKRRDGELLFNGYRVPI
jgi:hypothetical protein